jgi:hypothetical protein
MLILTTIRTFTLSGNKVHGGYDWSAGDAYYF